MISHRIRQIEIGGGAVYNLREPAEDDPRFWPDTAIDFAIAIRGETPNRDLGITDHLLAAGEWGLALVEMLSTISDDPRPLHPVIEALAERANGLTLKHNL